MLLCCSIFWISVFSISISLAFSVCKFQNQMNYKFREEREEDRNLCAFECLIVILHFIHIFSFFGQYWKKMLCCVELIAYHLLWLIWPSFFFFISFCLSFQGNFHTIPNDMWKMHNARTLKRKKKRIDSIEKNAKWGVLNAREKNAIILITGKE